MNVLGMGPLELALIGALLLVVVGPSKLPDLARQLGRFVGDLRRVTADVRAEFQSTLQIADPRQPTPVVRPAPPPKPEGPPMASDDLRPPY